MKKTIKSLSLIIIFVLFTSYSCKTEPKKGEQEAGKQDQTAKTELVEEVMTKEEQQNLTPDEVIKRFKEGNKRYMSNDLTTRDHSKQIRKTTKGQYPQAVVLSCIDSRVPVEDVFDKGIGDVFVARIAGNFENVDILGSLEYSCKVAGSKLVLVLGHEHCGAIKAAVDGVELGNITPMLEKIKPAITSLKYDGEKTSKNKEFVHMVCQSNVKNTIQQIRTKSQILKEMEEKGEIKIIGAIYDLDNGEVAFLE